MILTARSKSNVQWYEFDVPGSPHNPYTIQMFDRLAYVNSAVYVHSDGFYKTDLIILNPDVLSSQIELIEWLGAETATEIIRRFL